MESHSCFFLIFRTVIKPGGLDAKRVVTSVSLSVPEVMGLDDAECCICCEPVSVDQKVVRLECHPMHVLHERCTLQYVFEDRRCPYCREPMSGPDFERVSMLHEVGVELGRLCYWIVDEEDLPVEARKVLAMLEGSSTGTTAAITPEVKARMVVMAAMGDGAYLRSNACALRELITMQQYLGRSTDWRGDSYRKDVAMLLVLMLIPKRKAVWIMEVLELGADSSTYVRFRIEEFAVRLIEEVGRFWLVGEHAQETSVDDYFCDWGYAY
jgi:Ring finger domain